MSDDLSDLENDLNISEIDVDAIQMFEMFSAFKRAGFNERQALTLVALVGSPFDDTMVIYHVDDEDDE